MSRLVQTRPIVRERERIIIWDVESGTMQRFLQNVERFSYTRGKLVTANSNGVKVLDFESGRELWKIDEPRQFIGLLQDGKQMVTFDASFLFPREEKAHRIWDTDSGKEVFTLKLPTPSHIPSHGHPIFSQDDKKAFIVYGSTGTPASGIPSRFARIWFLE